MINPMDLTGKHILVTGGSSGIGRQVAIQASKLGAKVSLIARNEQALLEAVSMMDSPEKHACYLMDLSLTEQIEELVGHIAAERGAIDGLCHAAGLGTARILKFSKIAYVEKMFRIHEYAFIELVRCLSLKERLNEGASLVGISSVAAQRGNVSQGVYAAAKASMDGFIVPISQELASRKIRINTVAYAMVGTAMFDEFLEAGGDEAVMNRQLLGLIDVESASNVVIFLLSDACRYITGSVLPVYAGY